VTPYRICADTGLDKGMMSKFLSGQRWPTEANLNILAGYLGLRVVADATPADGGRK
jgi:transcriptional regulator with XRE-family HTH domain